MGQLNLSVDNPWLKIVKDDGFIAECDRNAFPNNLSAAQYAEAINNEDKEIGLTFSCLPDPFCGNPRSKVYCLNKNPGKPDLCFNDDNAYRDASIKNLQLKSDNCFWAENIKNKCGKVHDGVEWLRKRTKSLKEFLGCHPDIFFIEYFPYHSSKGFAFPKHLPSYDFSNALIKQAVEEKKLIVIIREKANWLKRLKRIVPHIEQYENLYTLKCAQGGYLTKANIVRIGTNNPLSVDEIKEYFKL